MISTPIVNIFFTKVNKCFHNGKYIGGDDGDPIPLSGDACQEVALTVPPYIAIGNADPDCDHFCDYFDDFFEPTIDNPDCDPFVILVVMMILNPLNIAIGNGIGNADRDCDHDDP